MRNWLKTHARTLVRWALIILVGVPLALTVIYRFVPPPITPLMLLRLAQGEGLHKQWMPLERISPYLMKGVIAAEDGKFCIHHGFDWVAIDNAIDRYEEGGRIVGASTISMQTAKNVFWWPGRNFLRKGLEAMTTVAIETIWGKRRIMEVYLNVIEWGHGIYGAEAAARHYFGKSAEQLNWREAAALASVLPSPRRWSPVHPSPRVAARIRRIAGRMGSVRTRLGEPCP